MEFCCQRHIPCGEYEGKVRTFISSDSFTEGHSLNQAEWDCGDA